MTLYNLFPPATTLPLNTVADYAALTVGTEFWVDAAGCTVTKLRYWQPNNADAFDNEGRIGGIYEIHEAGGGTYTLHASKAFPMPTAGQWCEVALDTPLALTPYTRYYAAVYYPTGDYCATSAFFSTGEGATSLVQGPVHRPNLTTSYLGDRQGTYTYFEGGLEPPHSSFNATSYFPDVEISFTEGGVTLSPSGIASAEVFGTPEASTTLTAEPGGIASVEALGTPVASTTLTATATAIDTLESFGTPTATATLTATADGIASEEALGSPAASTTLTASPSGIATDETFGDPAAGGSLTGSPGGIGSEEAFGTPAASILITASPAGIESTEAFGTPAVSTIFTASPSGIASAETFGDPAMSGTLTATAEGIESAAAFGTPSATGPATTATATGIGTLEVFGTPTANKRITLRPTAIASALAMGTPSAIHTPASVTATAVAISSLEVFGTPAASGSLGVPQGRDYAGSIPPSRYSGTYSNHRWDGSLG